MTLPADQRHVNVYVVHPDDVAAAGAIRRMEELAQGRAIDPFVGLSAAGRDELPDAQVAGKESETAELTEILAGVRVLDRVRLVGVHCANTDSEKAVELSQAIDAVKERLQESKAAHTTLIEVRVQAIEAAEFSPARRLFSNAAVANVVLIPHDRTSDLSAARFVQSGNPERFESHVAVELSSLMAGWATVSESPVDEWKPGASNGDSPQLFFARSIVRSLVCPPLPVDEIVSANRPLPVPDGFFPSPQPASTVRAVADRTFPSELRYVPSQAPDLQVEMGVKRASIEIPKRIVTIIRSLPQIFRDGISRDLESIQGDGLQELIGRDAWLSIAFKDRQLDAESTPWSERVDAAVLELEQRDDMPVLAQLPDEVWERLVARPFGIADGSGETEDARQATGESRYLVSNPHALSVETNATAEDTISNLLNTLDAAPTLPPPIEDTSETRDGDGNEDSSSADETTVSAPTPTGLATELSVRESIQARSNTTPPPGGLIGEITVAFSNQKRRADQRMHEMIGEIQRLAEESRADDESRRVPFYVQLMIAGGLLSVLYAVTVFTGLAKVTDLAWMGENARLVLWMLAAIGIVSIAAVIRWSSGKRHRVDVAVFGVALVIASLLAVNEDIRSSEFVSDNIGSKFWWLWPLSITVIGIGFYTRLRTPREPGVWRSALARFLGWGTGLFAAGVVIVASSSYYSALQPLSRFPDSQTPGNDHWTDSQRQRALIILVIVGLALTLAGLIAIGIIWVRVEYRNRSRGARFRFAVNEARAASRARRRLQLLTVQWLGTAVSITRVMWRPLGTVKSATADSDATYTADETLLKFQAATLELTPRGEELLLTRLRALLVKPGWLTNQYRRAATSFMAAEPSIIAADLHPDDWPTPQTCESAPNLDTVLDGTAEGRRWSYMRSLYDGVLDSALQEAVTDYSPSEVFATVLDTPQAASTRSHVENETSDPHEFFETLLPTGRQNLPKGLVSVAFTATDDRRSLTPHVSWPQELIPKQLENCTEIGHMSTLGIAGAVITAVRCDISPPFNMTDVGSQNPDDPFSPDGFEDDSDDL